MRNASVGLLALLGLLGHLTASAQTGVWNTNFAPAAARALGAAATVGGKIYLVGGGTYSCGVNSILQTYIPAANVWSNLASMPTARYEFGAAELNGKLYAISGNPGCGSAGSAMRTVEAYDPAANTWATKAQLPSSSGSWGNGVVSANGKIYFLHGFNTGVYSYDSVNNSWSTNASAPEPCGFGTMAVVNGIIYSVGVGAANLAVYSYNPVANTWATNASMPTSRYSTAGGAVNGLIYVTGGYSATGAVSLVEVFNPADNTWTTGTPMPRRVWAASAVVLTNTLYVMGGFNAGNSTVGDVMAFTPDTTIAAIKMYAGLTLTGSVGTTNRIDFITNVEATNWTMLTNLVLPTNPYLFIDTDSPSSPKRFYRAVQQ